MSPVQRTLVEPLSPVAPLDQFTGALATQQNPSFLSTLGHHVDSDGPAGLVSGLAVPRVGRSVPYAGTAELAVPQRERPRPAVQRGVVNWSTPTDTLDAPPEPFPETSDGSTGPMAASLRESERLTDLGQVEPVRPVPVDGAVLSLSKGPSTSSAHIATHPVEAVQPAPVEGAVATHPVEPRPPEPVEDPPSSGRTPTAPTIGNRPGGASSGPDRSIPLPVPAAVTPTLSAGTPEPSIQRRLTAVPDRLPRIAGFPPSPTVTLPVVARSAADSPKVVSRTATPASSPPTAAPAASSRPQPSAAAGGDAWPSAVDLDTTPVLAEAGPITVLPEPATPTAETATEAVSLAYDARPVGAPTDADIPTPASHTPEVSFSSTAATSPVDGFAGTPGIPPQEPENVMGAAPVSPVYRGDRLPTEAADHAATGDHPTVQQSLVGHSPPLAQRRPVARDEPLVQRTTTDRPGSVAPLGPAQDGFTVAPLHPTEEVAPTPLVESAAMPVRPPVDAVGPVGPTAPLSGFAARINALAHDESPVERVEVSPWIGSERDKPPTSEALPAGAPSTPNLVAAPVQRHAVVGIPVVQRSDRPSALRAPTASLMADRPPALSVRTDLSSAVDPAPPAQHVSFAPVVQSAVQRAAAPVVSRVAEPISISSPPVHAEPPSTPDLPRTQPRTDWPPLSTPMVQRSFAAMFAGSAESDTGNAGPSRSDDHPGFTTVQLQPAAEATPMPTPEPTPTAPPPEATPAPAAAAAAPTAGTSATDLDEMARRLYEPLSARLRAELWLDRERAGLVTDARH
jgi:hypothetical protein